MTQSSTITLVMKSIVVHVLLVCKTIQYEAAPFLAPKLAKLWNEPLRLIMDCGVGNLFCGVHGLLPRIKTPAMASMPGISPLETFRHERMDDVCHRNAFVDRCVAWLLHTSATANGPNMRIVFVPHRNGPSRAELLHVADIAHALGA
jgi:hypothetical protein